MNNINDTKFTFEEFEIFDRINYGAEKSLNTYPQGNGRQRELYASAQKLHEGGHLLRTSVENTEMITFTIPVPKNN